MWDRPGVPPDARRAAMVPVTPVLSARRVPALVAEPVADRRLRSDLAAWAAGIPDGTCAVVRQDDGDELLDLRGDEPVRPASTVKLLTATAALLDLGADHRFRTTLVGPVPTDGTVPGDLTLVGGGDPVLATADYAGGLERQPQIFTDLDGLAAALAQAGVQHVAGSIVGDDSRYDRERYVAGWPDRYRAQDEVGPLSALSVNDGFAVYPVEGHPGPLEAAADPAQQAAGVLTVLLQAHGITVDGAPRSGSAPAGAAELAAVESPPLADILEELLQESDNTTAELLTKELGRQAGDPTTAGGRARIAAVLGADGLAAEGFTVADGSGLSLDDRVTCAQLVEALRHPTTGELLVERLPVAGQTGTLDDRFLGTSLVGHLRAKTGSLNTVAALAGVVDDGDPPITFAVVVTVPDGRRVDQEAAVRLQASLGQVLLDWPRTPDLERLGPRPPRSR